MQIKSPEKLISFSRSRKNFLLFKEKPSKISLNKLGNQKDSLKMWPLIKRKKLLKKLVNNKKKLKQQKRKCSISKTFLNLLAVR